MGKFAGLFMLFNINVLPSVIDAVGWVAGRASGL